MLMTRSKSVLLILVLALPIFVACGEMSGDTGELQGRPPVAPRDRSTIEESDLYKLVGSRLYVHNPHSGLNVVDVSDPRAPRLLGRADVEGKAGELYVRQGRALVLLEQATSHCKRFESPDGSALYAWATASSELSIIDVRDATKPTVGRRICLPGEPVSSRIVGDTLYLVTTNVPAGTAYGSGIRGSHVLVIDLRDLDNVSLRDHRALPNAGREIHVTDSALFVASERDSYSGGRTVVDYYAIDGARASLVHRGQRELDGAPQGRFHIDANGEHLRIVTFDNSRRASILHVLSYGSDGLNPLGALRDIAPGERLYATRFDGDRAYVVTFRITDPLWIIDLSDARAPRIIGELQVPGWSDFIFPRGDRLLAVGRGNAGIGFGVSLFDISDLKNPRTLSQLTFGDGSNTGSAANSDHRAVTVIERAGELPLLLVPYSNYSWSYGSQPTDGGDSIGSGVGRLRQALSPAYSACRGEHFLQLVDVGSWGLTQRGRVEQRGAIQRTLVVGDALLSLSDRELASLDISDRDNVRHNTRLDMAAGKASSEEPVEACWGNGVGPGMWMGDDVVEWRPFQCSVPRGGAGAPPVSLLLLLAGLIVARAARRRRRRR